MKKIIAIITSIVVLFTNSYSQTARIKGNIRDTSNRQSLHQAVVALLQAKDSILVKFTRTDAAGNFELNHLPGGNFIIMISYPRYADYMDALKIDSAQEKTIPPISLILKAQLLQEVVVQQKVAAIRIKGDTTEYKADSFNVQANANVQDLLKKLPGLQVNSKGEITAQGEKVQKVLVDGEEFFSDDPAVVTKNLRADIVDKVQVYDKKSDQAEFTGVDDGEKNKTINLQLKEDKKKGYFGKLEAGHDFNRYRYGKAMANIFKGKQKIATYLTSDNTSYESLNWTERRNYTNNNNYETNEDGDMLYYNNNGDDFSNGDKGFPNSFTGGLLYSNKWNKDKYYSNTGYQFNQVDVTGRNTTVTQSLLPDTSFVNTTQRDFESNRQRNRVRNIFEWTIDSSSSFKLTVAGSLINNKNNNRLIGKSINEDSLLVNQSDRITTNNDETKNLLSDFIWRKKLKKKGRTISWTGKFDFTNKDNNGFLIANNDFYDRKGFFLRKEQIDQKKTRFDVTSQIGSKIIYTEPLSKTFSLEVNYRLGIGRNNSERNTLEKSSGDIKYALLIDTLSNHFIFNTTNHTAGFSIRQNQKKYNFSVGTALGSVVFNQQDVVTKNNRSISYTNFIPSAGFKFTPRKQRSVSLNYMGSPRNPSLQEIQPIFDNTDPLNISIGNKNLKQEFTHNIRLNANDYRVLKSRYLYMNANLKLIDNAISNSNSIDTLGRRIDQAINVAGNYDMNGWAGIGLEPIPSFNLGFNINTSISRNVNIINGKRNITNSKGLGLGANFGSWEEKNWVQFWANMNVMYNKSNSSIRPDATTNYWTFSASPTIEVKFPKKFYFATDADINVYQKTTVFSSNRDIYIVNASLKKTFGKSENLEAKIRLADIFNQNLGISRSISSNFITEYTQQSIQRYVMFSVTYNFSKNGKPVSW